MSDDLNNRSGIDRNLISLKEKHEVDYWTKAMGVTKEELQRLVEKVGHSAAKVREELRKRHDSYSRRSGRMA